MTHVISQVAVHPDKVINREKVCNFFHHLRTKFNFKICPLLLRIFCSTGRHHTPGDYARGKTPENELQIYTWMDCTLRELMKLIKDVNPEARRRGTKFSFSVGKIILSTVFVR